MAEESMTETGWTLAAAPYVWMAGVKGQVGVAGQAPSNVDADFGEIWDAIDWFPPPIMVMGEARNGPYAVFSDFFYIGLEADSTLSGPLGASVSVDMGVLVWTLGGSYRVLDTGTATLDLRAGGRLWHVDTDVSFSAPPFRLQASGSKTWVDPIVGASGSVDLGNGFGLYGEADIGGFGAAADLDWQVLGTVNYQYNDSVALHLGYRHLDVDYTEGGFVLDAALSGPIIGARFRF